MSPPPRRKVAIATLAPPGECCPYLHEGVELIGKRWTGAILRAMRYGHVRFSDISVAIPGLHDRLLSERLKELEAEGVVRREVIPETPVRIEYHLTDKGHALDGVMDAIADWAEQWVVVEPVEIEQHQECLEAEQAECDRVESEELIAS
jgi:DNA-binding HxlR family transcriptional regulator